MGLPLLCQSKDVSEDEGYRCLERTRLPNRRGEDDEKIEEDTKNGEGSDDDRDGLAEVPQILSQSITEEERDLHDEGKTLLDHLEAPSDHSSHPELPVAAALDEKSFDVEVGPCFPKMARNAASSALARELNRID